MSDQNAYSSNSSGTSTVRQMRVLLVEDSENDALLLLHELRRGGYGPIHERVYTPEDMERALFEAEERGEPWEMIISDYYMPRFRAPDALSLLRRLGYDTPFIVVSGKVGEEVAVDLMRAGAQDYITKENMTRLNLAIERELREAAVRRERERAEAELSRSENRFQKLVEQAADAVFVHDHHGRFVDVNRQACETLGYTREELLRMSVSEIEVARDSKSLEATWEQMTSGTPRTLEGVHRRKDGTTFPVEVRVGALEYEGRHLTLALARDISERLEGERKLREAEARYRTLVEQIPAITYIQEPIESDTPKAVTYMSPQYEALLGYTPEMEILDEEHWLRVLHPEDRERVLEEEDRTDASGEPFRIEYRVIARDGRAVWLRDEAVLVRDEEGRPLYWQGVQYDITRQKRIESELRQSEQRYRTFIAQSTEGIWRFELEEPLSLEAPEDEQLEHAYRCTYLAECNDAMAQMYGYERAEELIGARLGDLLPRSESKNIEYLRAFLEAGCRLMDAETWEFDREGNPRIFLNNLTGTVENGYLVRAWGTQRDVTERRRAEDRLRRSEHSLAEAQRIAHIGNWDYEVVRDRAYWSEELYNIFGITPREFVPTYRSFLNLVHPEDRRIVRAAVREALYSEKRSSIDYRIVRPDGGTRFVNTKYETVVDESGRAVRLTGTIHDITERKRAEEALQMSETRFRTVIEQSPLSIQILAPDGRTLRVNRAWEELWGATLEDIGDYNLLEDRQLVDKGVTPYLLRGFAGEPTRIPPIVYDPEDTIPELSWHEEPRRWVQAFIYPVKDAAGEIREIVLVHEDVTERRRAEDAVRESEERFRSMVQNASDVIMIIDADGTMLYESPAIERILGFKPEERVGSNALSYVHPDDVEAVKSLFTDLVENRVTEPVIEYRVRARDGVWRHLEAIGRNLLRDPAVRGIVVNSRDVTERLEGERKLREAEARYRMLVEQLPTVTYVDLLDETGATSYISPQVESLLGYSPQEFLQEPGFWKRLLHPDDRERVLQVRGDCLASGEPFSMEYRFIARNGRTVWVRDEAMLVRDEAGEPKFWQGVQIDVTDRKAIEQAQSFLIESGMVLASSLDYQATLASVAELAVPRLADWCAVDMVNDAGEIERLAVVHEDPEKVALARELQGRFPIDPDASNGVPAVIRTGRPEIVKEISEEMINRSVPDQERRDLLKALGFRSYMVVPFVGRRGAVGAITLVSAESGRQYGDDDLRLAEELGRRAALAIDNAHLYEEAQREISERKRTEQTLLQSEELYRTVVEQAAENIFVVDLEDMSILEANTALSRSLGYAPEEIRELKLYDVIAHDRESIDLNARRIVQERRHFIGERQYRRKDGSLVDVEVSASAISYRDGEALCIVAHDITERKNVEQALQEAREAERSRIARDLHDDILQNLVYALQEIQIIQITSGDGGAPALEDTADALRRSVEGLRVAIFELRLSETLDISLSSSLRALLELNRRMSHGRYRIELTISDDFPQRLSEKNGKELVRILQEALSNARRHASPRTVRVELGRDGDTAWARVRDDGKGFSPGFSDGGVGMSSMRRRAQDLGGVLSIDSQPGAGTLVSIEIPLERLSETEAN